MKTSTAVATTACAMALVACATTPGTGQPGATGSAGRVAAPMAMDEGGPVTITGDWKYTSSLVLQHFQEPVVALFNVAPYLRGQRKEWVPRESQVPGLFTTPLSPAPVAYRVDVPRQARGVAVDLDNDGTDDAGVRVYAVHIGPNLVGDSWLEQMEQVGYNSYLLDPVDGTIREGTFLVHAPDAAQGFPSSAGADGRFFTADDPAVALPAGWTLVALSREGTVRFDRSREGRMDALEEAAAATPDFSSQGILQGFDSLVDLLKKRYAYTDLRQLDWEAIRRQYRPRVEAADAADDLPAYYMTLNELAHSIRDTHVYVDSHDLGLRRVPTERFRAEWGASLGAGGVELDDGRYVVTYVDPAGPAAKAGWSFGTEIVSVDGEPMAKRIDSLPLLDSNGTPESIRLTQAALALVFPADRQVKLTYRLPAEKTVRSATMQAAAGLQTVAPRPVSGGDIAYRELEGGYGYASWSMFSNPLYTIAIWEKFLEQFHSAPGLVIDLRANGGGNAELMYTMGSYFFTPDAPASYHWLDYYTYDEAADGLVKSFAYEYPLYSPRPELTYAGAVAVLVSENSASAAEYMPQFLQYFRRAIVVGEHGSKGAGGNVEVARLPGKIDFYFTKGRSFFAGTEELNLEAKGVKLDVRVPVTLDNERAKADGRDPVLEAAVAALGQEAQRVARTRLAGRTWQATKTIDAVGSVKEIATPANYTVQFAADGTLAIRADCNRAQGRYTFGDGGVLKIELGPATLAACGPDSLDQDFLHWLGAAQSIQFDVKELLIMTDPSTGMMGVLLSPAE